MVSLSLSLSWTSFCTLKLYFFQLTFTNLAISIIWYYWAWYRAGLQDPPVISFGGNTKEQLHACRLCFLTWYCTAILISWHDLTATSFSMLLERFLKSCSMLHNALKINIKDLANFASQTLSQYTPGRVNFCNLNDNLKQSVIYNVIILY